jgi:integrase
LVGPKVARTRVLNDEELRALWAASEQLGYPVGAAMKMLLLCGQRKSEVTMARWREFSLPNKLWTIPAERFKSKVEHIVPLSDAMLKLLDTLPRWASGDFLFSSNGGRTPITGFQRGKRQLEAAVGAAAPWVVHDTRRTVRTRLSGLHVAEHVAELVIGHAKRGLERIYNQHRYERELRAALEAWAKQLQSIIAPAAAANVVPLELKHP